MRNYRMVCQDSSGWVAVEAQERERTEKHSPTVVNELPRVPQSVNANLELVQINVWQLLH